MQGLWRTLTLRNELSDSDPVTTLDVSIFYKTTFYLQLLEFMIQEKVIISILLEELKELKNLKTGLIKIKPL